MEQATNPTQTIVPFLWFDKQAEEAMHFYTSVFKNSQVGSVTRYGDETPGLKGQVMTASFRLNGQEFVALNGGPQYQFTEAVSFAVHCETQAEVDALWEQLTSEGGKPGRCGWLKDRFGLSWQVVPRILPRLLQGKDPQKTKRVVQALMQMDKIDSVVLQQAYDGEVAA